MKEVVMTYTECMIKLGELYKQPAMDQTPHGPMPNLVYSEAFEWIETNVPEEEVHKYYRMITRHFEPTSTNPFPLPKHLADIWAFMQKADYHKPYQREPIDYIERLDLPKLSPRERAAIKWQDVLDDDSRMSSRELLKKYGKDACCEVWAALGSWAQDTFKNPESHQWLMKKLEEVRPNHQQLAKHIADVKSRGIQSPFSGQ